MKDPRRIPVLLLTGFLGSGKTTLLNRLLRDAAFSDSAVIINEFGAVGIDHLVVAAARDNILLLEAGCLCCVQVDSLRETLADLYHRRQAASVPAFKRVLIETSGLADPAPVLQTLARDTLVAPLFAVQSVVCAADALNVAWQLERHVEAREQLAVADRVVITKSDLLPPAAIEPLAATLAARSPAADVVIAPRAGSVAPLFQLRRELRPLPTAGAAARHDSDISGEGFIYGEPATMSGVAAWTGHLAERFGDDLLRCKALLRLRGKPGRIVVQGVRRLFDIEHDARPELEGDAGRIMCIGRNLRRDVLESGLYWLQTPERTAFPRTAGFAPWGKGGPAG